MYKRTIAKRVKQMNDTFRVLILTGPRQVGKSTLLESLIPEGMNIISLDDLSLRELAQADPRMFLETYSAPIFIDEVQYAPELFPYIKMRVDKDKTRGQYWLSGSQRFELMKNVTESLAGRVGILNMNSFTYNEIMRGPMCEAFNPENLKQKDFIDVNRTFELIFAGGMPELYDTEGLDRNDFYDSYIKTYIERDVALIKDIGSTRDFRRFMREVAIRVGTTLNYADIAKEVGVSGHTIQSWLSVLESTGLVYLLEAYSSNLLKRITQSPKIIFMDMGLCAYLAGWQSARDLQLSDASGHYLESYIISEIIKNNQNLGANVHLYHIRNKETDEIDLIMEKNDTLYPIEIKKTSTPRREMLKTFRMLDGLGSKVGSGGIICTYDKLMPLDEHNYIIPISSAIDTRL